MYIFTLIAFRNLFKNKSRTLILGGVVAGIALVMTVLLSLIQGIQSTMIHNGTALMSGHVNIAGFYKISSSSSSPTVTAFKELLEIAKTEVPEAELIVDRVKAYGRVISEMDSIQVPMWGVNFDQEEKNLRRLELAPIKEYWDESFWRQEKADATSETSLKNGERIEGRWDDLNSRGTLVLFASQARKLKVRVGDMVTLSMPTYRNISNTMDVRVVAVLRDLGLMSQFSLFLHADDAREIYQIKKETTGQIMLFLKDIKSVPLVEERLRKILAQKGYVMMEKEAKPFFLKMERVSGESWTGQKIDITTWEDETSFLKWVVQLLSSMSSILILVLLMIVVLGLMNTLWMSIRERTSEIGTLRAIGLQRRQVFLLFLLESFFLIFGGTLIGALLGFSLVELLNSFQIPLTIETLKVFLMSNTLSFEIGWVQIFQVFIIMLTFLLIGALFPIWQATRLKPVSAIQNVN